MFGLSPVISIEQKTIGRNPRSTVGTMTDISSYLNLLFATIGVAHCPCCNAGSAGPHEEPDPRAAAGAAAKDTSVELRAPVFKVYGEDDNFLFAEIRKKGYRRMVIDGKEMDISEDVELDETARARDGSDRRSVHRAKRASRSKCSSRSRTR